MDREYQIGIHEKLVRLHKQFFKTDRYQRLEEEFDRLLYQRRADPFREARGLVVVGESGSGKTTSLRRLFASHTDLVLSNPENNQADVVSLSIPSPATYSQACRLSLPHGLRLSTQARSHGLHYLGIGWTSFERTANALSAP